MLGDVRSRPEREMKLHLSMYLTRDYCAVQRRQAYRFKVRIAPKRTSKVGACYVDQHIVTSLQVRTKQCLHRSRESQDSLTGLASE